MYFDIGDMLRYVDSTFTDPHEFIAYHVENGDALGVPEPAGPCVDFGRSTFKLNRIIKIRIFRLGHGDIALRNTEHNTPDMVYTLDILDKSKIYVNTFGAHSTVPPLAESDP